MKKKSSVTMTARSAGTSHSSSHGTRLPLKEVNPPKEKKSKQKLSAAAKHSVAMIEQSAATEPLKLVLADTFVLYMKTYAVHWNYRGDKFFSVHKLTETQYQELAAAIDEIAERIRALGGEAPISLSAMLNSSDLTEFEEHSASEDRALQELAAGHLLLAKRAQEAAEKFDKADDLYSNDLLIGRIGAHEKAAWMLRSFA